MIHQRGYTYNILFCEISGNPGEIESILTFMTQENVKPVETTELCWAVDHSDFNGGMSFSEHGMGIKCFGL